MQSLQGSHLRKGLTWCFIVLLVVSLWIVNSSQHPTTAYASTRVATENNGASPTPFMGWSSWNFIGSHPTEANMEAQAQVVASKLKSSGYNYILLDDFWYLNPSTTVDANGYWSVDTSKFPNGLSGLASYVHGLGLKVGFYLTPGIPVAAVNQNTPIAGTSYHARDIADTSHYEANYNYGNVMYAIDYSKPGAQAYINGWADQLASWGADFLKLDGVGDGDVGDIQAWSQALNQSGRTILFDLSNSLDVNNVSTWQKYSNAWRIDGDVECYCSTQVTWGSFSGRFNDAARWAQYAGPNGWNDLDALQIADGSKDGISNDERQTYMTLWAIEAAPLYAGDDLTTMDSYGLSLLTNSEVIAVDQAGRAAHPVSQASSQQVWYTANSDGSYTVALFNLGGSSANVTANWSDLGFSGSASVRDLWSHSDLGSVSGSFSATLNTHASRLLKVTPASGSTTSTSYEAESSANTLAGGAAISSCSGCSGGQKVGYVGNGGTLQFNNVNVANAGTYLLTIAYVDGDAGRSAQMSINGNTASTLNFAGTNNSDWNTVQSTSVPVILQAGNNTILFSNPSGWAPDFDRVTVSGSGYVRIVNRNSGKLLDVSNDSTANNATIVQYTSNGQADQEWSLADAGSGYVKIINRNSGKLLNIPGPTTTQGTQLIQYSDDGNSNSQWSLASLSGGYFDIASRYDSQDVDVSGGSTADNGAVIQWPNNNGTNQQWSFVAI